MRTNQRTLLLSISALTALTAFSQDRDPFEPAVRESSICGITSRGIGREAWLFEEEKDPKGGGGKTFTQEDVDKIIQERVGKLTDKLKVAEAAAAEVAELKKRVGDFDEEKRQAALEAELKGKTELEKAQLLYTKAQEKLKALETELAKSKTDGAAALQAKDAELTTFRKQTIVGTVLSAGAANERAAGHALRTFMSEAEIELDEKGALKGISYDGKTYAKPEEAAKAFYDVNTHFAKPANGGSGGPKQPIGGGHQPAANQGVASLLSSGLNGAG